MTDGARMGDATPMPSSYELCLVRLRPIQTLCTAAGCSIAHAKKVDGLCVDGSALIVHVRRPCPVPEKKAPLGGSR